jgi:hypothetical protein
MLILNQVQDDSASKEKQIQIFGISIRYKAPGRRGAGLPSGRCCALRAEGAHPRLPHATALLRELQTGNRL